MNNYIEARCLDCGSESLIRIVSETLVDPSYPESDTCSCGGDLDLETAEPAAPPEPDPDRFRE